MLLNFLVAKGWRSSTPRSPSFCRRSWGTVFTRDVVLFGASERWLRLARVGWCLALCLAPASGRLVLAIPLGRIVVGNALSKVATRKRLGNFTPIFGCLVVCNHERLVLFGREVVVGRLKTKGDDALARLAQTVGVDELAAPQLVIWEHVGNRGLAARERIFGLFFAALFFLSFFFQPHRFLHDVFQVVISHVPLPNDGLISNWWLNGRDGRLLLFRLFLFFPGHKLLFALCRLEPPFFVDDSKGLQRRILEFSFRLTGLK
ncbi:hypothetical protein BC567DRAFT_224694 [Phyllosticta citribraziliensis]